MILSYFISKFISLVIEKGRITTSFESTMFLRWHIVNPINHEAFYSNIIERYFDELRRVS